ncbi:ADP-ribosylation factor protein 3 [Gurleya vavrai]
MIKKILKQKNEYKILFIGSENAGKTTILHNLFKTKIESIEPTFGYQIHNFKYPKYNVNLNVLDLGGQLSLQKYWNNFYEKIDGIVFVYDLTDERNYVELFMKVIDENEKVPFIILGNKCDLVDINFEEKEMENGKKFVCSGKTGFYLELAFDWLIQKIIKT